MRRQLSLFTLVVLAGCGRAATPKAPDREAAMETQVLAGLRPAINVVGATPVRYSLAERMAFYKAPGVSIAVIDSGRVVWARGFGVKEAGTTDSVTATTLFQAASISKPVAATVMLKLVDEGKLALDVPISTYLKSWKLPDNKFTVKEKVTLRRIVSHNAGLTVHGFPGYAVTDSIPTVPQVLDGIKPANTGPVRVDTFPGAIWRYSGGGTTAMQMVIMDVTSEPFEVTAKRLVLDPMGMTHSTYAQPLPATLRGQEAAAHQSNGSMTPGRWHIYPEQAPAGLWTTPSDLLKWALEIAAAREGKSTKVLTKQTATDMLTPQKAPTGLGPFLEGSGRAFNFGHGGANEGFRSQLIYFPETGQGAAVMTNSDNGGVLQEILYAIAAAYQWPEYGPKDVAITVLDSTRLDRFTGEYELPGQPLVATVSREGQRLFLTATGRDKGELGMTDSTKAIDLNDGTEFQFVFGKGSVVEGLTVAGFKLKKKKGA